MVNVPDGLLNYGTGPCDLHSEVVFLLQVGLQEIYDSLVHSPLTSVVAEQKPKCPNGNSNQVY